MGQGIGQESAFPGLIAGGTLDGSAGTPTITSAAIFGCSTPVSSAKGVYTITLLATSRPQTTSVAANGNCYIKCGALTASQTVSFTYVTTTGVITFTVLTSDTKAAAEGALWFEVTQVRQSV